MSKKDVTGQGGRPIRNRGSSPAKKPAGVKSTIQKNEQLVGFDTHTLLQPGKALDLLSQLREESERQAESGRKVDLRTLIGAYQVALLAREDEDLWSEICGSQQWEGFGRPPKIQDQGQSLRAVIRLTVGFADGSRDKVAKQYAALKEPFEQGTPVAEVAELLRGKGGIGGMRKRLKPLAQIADATNHHHITLHLSGEEKVIRRLKTGGPEFWVKINLVTKRSKTADGVVILAKPLLRLPPRAPS